jgi:hypothetical protein
LSDLITQIVVAFPAAQKDIASVAVEIAFSHRISMRPAQVRLMLTEHQTYYKNLKYNIGMEIHHNVIFKLFLIKMF